MSPAPARTSTAAVIAAGRELLASGGPDAVTMQAVAARVGVRAPSLYKRFADRDAVLAAVAADVADEIAHSLAPRAAAADPAAALRSIATGLRDFARADPRAFELLFRPASGSIQAPLERIAAAAAPLIALTERLVGPGDSVSAARLITAFGVGFASMEIAGAFRLGGDVDAAFSYGIDRILAGLTQQ